jgi:hypothetical protein
MYINIIQHTKIHPRIPFTTLVLKYIFKISNYAMSIIVTKKGEGPRETDNACATS